MKSKLLLFSCLTTNLVGDHIALVIKHCFFIDLSSLTVNITFIKAPVSRSLPHHSHTLKKNTDAMVLCESLLFEPFPLPIPQHKENFHNDKTDSSHRRALLKEPGLITTYDLLSKLNFHFLITITLEMHENTSKPTEIGEKLREIFKKLR